MSSITKGTFKAKLYPFHLILDKYCIKDVKTLSEKKVSRIWIYTEIQNQGIDLSML